MSSTIAESFIAEIKSEAEATKRHFEAIPEDKLEWRPHEKSMTLGQLALHIATSTGGIAEMLQSDTVAFEDIEKMGLPQPASRDELFQTACDNLKKTEEILGQWDDAYFATPWTITKGGEPMMTMPRAACVRAFICSHVYHHRGQFSVYLRLLDVPVPSTYGPSADVNPFAPAVSAAS